MVGVNGMLETGRTKMKTFKEFIIEYSIILERADAQSGRNFATFGRPQRKMKRNEVIISSVAKRAGIRGTGKLSTKDLRTSPKQHSTYDSEDELDDIGSTKQDTTIASYSSPRQLAHKENLIRKVRSTGKGKARVIPSRESVRKVKDLRKQMIKSGANKKSPTHVVDILPRDPNVVKNDPENKMERGRNFFKSLKDLDKNLKNAGVKKGDTIVGSPSSALPGEGKNKKERQVASQKRENIYKKVFGKRTTPRSKTTGFMMGKA